MDQAEPPRAKRHSVILKALLRSDANPAGSEHRVRNLSASGACIDHAGDLRAGDDVVVFVGEVTNLAASVAWTTDRLAGIRFEREIDLEAARRRRAEAPALKSGWMANMNHAYRKTG